MPTLNLSVSPSLTAVPNQNTTLYVTPSTDFGATSYAYQWKKGASVISGATSSSYFFEPVLGDGATYTCLVSGFVGASLSATATSAGIGVTIRADSSIFDRWTPKGANPLNESGQERFSRMRNLGYC